MLRQGYTEAADAYCREHDWLRSFNDAIVYKTIYGIKQDLKCQKYQKALEFCFVNRSKLQKMESRLEFRLHT